MKIFKLREKLGRRGLLLLEHGTGWQVTNNGTVKTLIEHNFDDLEAVEAWVADLPNRMTEEEAEVFDEEFEEFASREELEQFIKTQTRRNAEDQLIEEAADRNQCDGCRRGLPLDENNVHHGEGYDMIGCTRSRYVD